MKLISQDTLFNGQLLDARFFAEFYSLVPQNELKGLHWNSRPNINEIKTAMEKRKFYALVDDTLAVPKIVGAGTLAVKELWRTKWWHKVTQPSTLGFISWLFVLPEHRVKGVFKSIFREGIEEVRRLGLKQMTGSALVRNPSGRNNALSGVREHNNLKRQGHDGFGGAKLSILDSLRTSIRFRKPTVFFRAKVGMPRPK